MMGENELRTVMRALLGFISLCALALVAGCETVPSLDQLEDEAMVTGDWEAVERREDLIKRRLESTAPGCPKGEIKKCFEAPSGIQCYCLRLARERY